MHNDIGPIHIPPFAHYDCKLCGWCCRQYYITFSEEERRALVRRDWDALVPQVAGKAWYEATGKARPGDPWQLRPREDGRCLFLSDDRLCLMHRHVGEMGKPLPCGAFPFTVAFTPSGVYVGLRYSCPAAGEGHGRPWEARRDFLARLVDRLRRSGPVPRYVEPVRFDPDRVLAWDDYLKLEDALVATMLRTDMSLTHRVVMAWRLVGLVGQLDLDKVSGQAFLNRLQDLGGVLAEKFRTIDIPQPELLARERVVFRQFAYLFHRRTGPAFFQRSWWWRLGRRLAWLQGGVRFARGRGCVLLTETDRPIDLRDLETVRMEPFDPEQAGLLSRYLAGKLFAKHVFGRLFHDFPFRQGYTVLTAAYAAILWYARGLALAAGREVVATRDLVDAIRLVDFCYGYSKAPTLPSERLRVWALARDDSAARLAVAYGPRANRDDDA